MDVLRETDTSLRLDLTVIAAVNDDATLENNLLRSELIANKRATLSCYRGFRSASAAYNAGLDETRASIVVFVHQDVFLPPCWEDALARAIREVEQIDPDWGVLGAFGLDPRGRAVGHVWSSGLGRRVGKRRKAPLEAVCLDELLIILRRDSGLRFDPDLPGFHLYGTDIVLAARAAGLRSYVADIPVIHNSRPVRQLGPDYVRAYRYMQRKWRAILPVSTPIVPITRNPWPLLRTRLRMALSWKKRAGRSTDPKTDPRKLVQKLDAVQS